MSLKYPGGFITKSPTSPTAGIARGMWSLSQAASFNKQGLWPTISGVPTSVVATAGVASASVAFTAPANIGSAAITAYTVTSSPGSFTGTGASSPITVSGLTNGTAYTFTVTATNPAGTSAASAASTAVTPSPPPDYIDDVFNTYLYTGTGGATTITNGIDLSTNGGLVWVKNRTAATQHVLTDSAITPGSYLSSNSVAAVTTAPYGVSSFTTTGFGFPGGDGQINNGSYDYVAWTFRKKSKFFDVVGYTGNGSVPRSISHNLASIPGCVIIKLTSGSQGWIVRHRSVGDTPNDMTNNVANDRMFLNTTGAAGSSSNIKADATTFTVGHAGDLNANGATYVAYLFAHNAGGFGASGNDSVISCGQFTSTGEVTLGWEPQWIMMKSKSNTNTYTGSWRIFDNMRGVHPTSDDAQLFVEDAMAEDTGTFGTAINFTATGFTVKGQGYYGDTIYIAIRRPMKPPTVGTSVFTTVLQSNNSAGTLRTVGFAADTIIGSFRTSTGNPAKIINSRLTNGISNRISGTGQTTPALQTNSTNAEANGYPLFYKIWNTTARDGDYIYNSAGTNWMFRRAPTFMDSVLYTGTGSQQNISHNLTVAPELLIVKRRSAAGASWATWATSLTADESLALNTTDSKTAVFSVGFWGSTYPTSSVFTVGSNINTNNTSQTYIAHLFATCPGVSKVGSYTGTGALQTINCGFTTGARFILIKRTDSSGAWYVWDSARGISSGTDPYSNINDSAAETTGTNYVDTVSTGFQVTAAAPADLNASGATYIFLAIA